MATIAGSVDRIVFRNSESGFCVARFRLVESTQRGSDMTTIVGPMPSVRPGEMLRLTGEWQIHPVHGRNFRVERFEQELPTTVEGIERFLASGAIRGVGPVTASRIVEHFGERTLSVIDEEPELLQQVAGTSRKRLEVIRQSWQEQKKVRDLMMFLQAHDISVALAYRIHQAYGEDAVAVIRDDPYRMAHDIHGVGFRTADAVARQLGISKRSPSRFVAGLKYTLSRATEEGHVFLPRPRLLERAAKLLEAEVDDLEAPLLELLRRGDAVLDDGNVYLTPFYRAEAGSGRLLRTLASTASVLTLDRRFNPETAAQRASEAQGLVLEAGQLEAVERALTDKVSILTGGPGTGKTSTLRTVITALEQADISYCLCAPTGRAAKRAAEATSRSASTIHRLLQFQPSTGLFGHDQTRPLPYDFVIVDEVSMLDILLFYHLLKAVPPESHLLLVGDADQLPAVGPGNVLRDLISSEVVPTTTLTHLFRQARGSQIVLAAHAVNAGRVPTISHGPDTDLFFLKIEDANRVVDAIKRLVGERIPRKFGLDPVDDVQVISPMHEGPAGVTALNSELQALLNPRTSPRHDVQRGGRTFRLGDKVMQIRNDYDKDVYNGDVGKVVAVRPDDQGLTVSFPTSSGQQRVDYDMTDLDELVLAYATSVHKAQGSEFPCIVMPLVTRHFILLRRHLLYTALTRAKQLCILVGTPRALTVAVNAGGGELRNTRLAQRLSDPYSETLQLDLS